MTKKSREARAKIFRSVTAVLLVFAVLCAGTVMVFADEYPQGYPTGDTESETAEGPSDDELIFPSEGFTDDGNAEVQDHVTKSISKEFYTVQTKNGNVFYIIIDKARTDDNVYFLSQVDERDLEDFLDDDSDAASLVLETPAPTAEVEEEPEEESGSGAWLLLFLLILLGGGALFYFKVYKPQQEEETITPENAEREVLEARGEGAFEEGSYREQEENDSSEDPEREDDPEQEKGEDA